MYRRRVAPRFYVFLLIIVGGGFLLLKQFVLPKPPREGVVSPAEASYSELLDIVTSDARNHSDAAPAEPFDIILQIRTVSRYRRLRKPALDIDMHDELLIAEL